MRWRCGGRTPTGATPVRLRLHYSKLWYSLLTRDHESGREAATALGVAAADYDYLSLLLTFRPATSRTALGTRLSKDERTRVRQRLAKVGRLHPDAT